MVNRLVSVGDDFTLPAAVKAADGNLPDRLQDAALNATYAGKSFEASVAGKADKVTSPRDTVRVKGLRKPVAVVDKQFPNAHVDYDIVWVETGSMYGLGKDRSLYNSIDRGYTWSTKISNSGTAGKWALGGLFRKTTAGSLITTYDPDDLSPSSIIRSTNGGSTWTTVVPAKAGVGYLNGGALCQDLNTGYLYLLEYTVADTTTVPTVELLRSTDDGATWSSFKSWTRTGAGFIRHGHTVQYDPISQRVYILTGDGEPDGGIYRVNSAGTGVEPVVLNSNIVGGPTHTTAEATAVGIMFFPDYIAWGMDGSADSYLLRMNRNQIGQAAPQVEQIMRLQNTAWWATRVKADGTGWFMSVSGPAGGAGSDELTHLYYVSDNGATCDQVLTLTGDSVASSALGPIGTPLQTGSTIWLSARQRGDALAAPRNSAFQIGVQLGFGDVPLSRPDSFNRAFYAPQHRASGKLTSTAVGQIQTFGVSDVPANARRLYILNMGAYTVGGTGAVKVTVNNLSAGGAAVNIKGTSSPIESGSRDWRTQNGMETAPYIMVSDLLTATHRIEFRINCTSVTTSVDTHAFIDFAWGF